jgi:hypothetical protein
MARKPIANLLRALIDEHEPDILILAECTVALPSLLTTINSQANRIYTIPFNNSTRLVFLSALPSSSFQSLADEGGIAIRRVFPPLGEDLILAGLHLGSKLYLSNQDQSELAIRLRIVIEETERRVGHQRTIVIGDLNMDPFERGLMSSESLHAVMDRQVAERQSRIVHGQERHFFYNPMWGRLGDMTIGPPGTYYHESPSVTAYFWHTFDQVLIRPSLLPRFREQNLKVLTVAGATSLIYTTGSKTGRPDKRLASDHLPLFLTI